MVLYEVETPLAFEREVALAGCLVCGSGLDGGLKGEEAGARFLGVDTCDVGVEPRLLLVLCRNKGGIELQHRSCKEDEEMGFHAF